MATKTKTKSDKRKLEQLLLAPKVASANPWRRFAKGADLEMAISRGREDEALWILADGASPPKNLLADALCSAAYQGMSRLCSELGRRGAGIGDWPLTRTLWTDADDAWQQKTRERSYPPGVLALFGGRLDLAKELAAALGESVFGSGPFDALLYGALCCEARGTKKGKMDVLTFVRSKMGAKELALAANMLSLEGAIDDALDILETAPVLEQGRIARFMLAPLAGYAPTDNRRELAWIALERAVELCEGGQVASWALRSPFDHRHANVESYSSAYKRQGAIQEIARRCSQWGRLGPRWRPVAMDVCWPRVAAVMAGNERALDILSSLPWASDEFVAIKRSCDQVLAIHEKTLAVSDMPHFFAEKSMAGFADMGPSGPAWARAGLALIESKEIHDIVKASERKNQKERRRELRGMSDEERARSEAAAAPKPRRSSRL